MYVYWICDKGDCKRKNYRIIDRDKPMESNDDTCDSCTMRIHEPIYIEHDGTYKPEQ